MTIAEISLLLSAQGWVESAANPFREKISQGAQFYATYQNNQNTVLGLAYFGTKDEFKLKVQAADTQDFTWFLVESKDKTEDFLSTLLSNQATAAYSNYFSLYLALSGVCPTSILAWEQWEDNYR
jgi:hypothetical protein